MESRDITPAGGRAGVRDRNPWRRAGAAVFTLLILTGCPGSEPGEEKRMGEPEVTETRPAPETEAPAPGAEPAVLDWDDLPAVEPDGFGPVRVGMTLEEASAAVGGELARPEGAEEACFYVYPEDAPKGLGLMFSEGRLVRIDVTTDAYETASGAQVGMATEEVQELYDDGLAVSPHKYDEGGSYLTLTPAGDLAATHRLLFETNDGEVAAFRAGQLPQVQWVEGCS